MIRTIELTRTAPPTGALAAGSPGSTSRLVTEDLGGLNQLAAEWGNLEPFGFGPVEHFAWSRACLEQPALYGKLKIFSVWQQGHCRAIAPLAVNRARLPRLESLGVKELTEPMDLLFRDRESLGALCDALARQRLPLDLPRVPEESAVGAELRRAFRGRGYVHIAKASPYPTMRIDASWREPESHFNAGRRSDFRRAQRAAERHGAVQFEIVTPTAENLDALLAEAYQVELQSWKGRAGTALAVDQLRAPVYRQYFRMACERGILRIVLMRIDGRAVGMQLVTETNQRLWLMKIGHDEQYSKASPGTLLMLELARYAAARDIQSIEFLGSAESWTQLWSEELRQCVRIRAFPVGVTSGLAFIDDAAQSAWTSLRRKFNRANP